MHLDGSARKYWGCIFNLIFSDPFFLSMSCRSCSPRRRQWLNSRAYADFFFIIIIFYKKGIRRLTHGEIQAGSALLGLCGFPLFWSRTNGGIWVYTYIAWGIGRGPRYEWKGSWSHCGFWYIAVETVSLLFACQLSILLKTYDAWCMGGRSSGKSLCMGVDRESSIRGAVWKSPRTRLHQNECLIEKGCWLFSLPLAVVTIVIGAGSRRYSYWCYKVQFRLVSVRLLLGKKKVPILLQILLY